jgi:hypothetical protein
LEDNINIDLKTVYEIVDWTQLAQDSVQWLVLVITVMNIRPSIKRWEYADELSDYQLPNKEVIPRSPSCPPNAKLKIFPGA